MRKTITIMETETAVEIEGTETETMMTIDVYIVVINDIQGIAAVAAAVTIIVRQNIMIAFETGNIEKGHVNKRFTCPDTHCADTRQFGDQINI